jgi:MFS family permease
LGSRRRYLALLLLGNVCAGTSWGILSPTLIASCVARGSSTLVIGIIASIWALPFLVAAPLYTRIIARYSARGCLAAGILADVILVWLFPVFPHDVAWILLQVLGGATMGHFCLITEAWLNLFAPERWRARVTSLYGIVPAVGYAIGAGLYILLGARGLMPYLGASVAMALSLVPVLFIPATAADGVMGGERRVGHAFAAVPLLLTIAFLAGVLEMVPWSLLQVFALDNRWPMRAAACVLPVFYFGQVLLNWPLGVLADRWGRRSVLLATSAAAILCMLAMALCARSPFLWVVILLSGGIATATYTLSLAILGQRFEAAMLVSANAAFLACYGLGTILGPPVVGALMDRAGPAALPAVLGFAAAGILLCASAGGEWRGSRRSCATALTTAARG